LLTTNQKMLKVMSMTSEYRDKYKFSGVAKLFTDKTISIEPAQLERHERIKKWRKKGKGEKMEIEKMYVGQVYEVKRIVTDEMIKMFAEATGDKNPVHFGR